MIWECLNLAPESLMVGIWSAYLATELQERGLTKGQNAAQEQSILQDYIRIHHQERCEEYISASGRTELGLDTSGTSHEATIVGRISLGHRVVDLGDDSHFSEQPFRNEQIRRRLLAAYLRLADELDTTAFRTPVAEAESVVLANTLSLLEWGKHLSISGVAPEGDTIVSGGACDDPDVHFRL